MTTPKTATGHFFEDFSLGQVMRHATPRTVTQGDAALYLALFGSRFAVTSSDEVACGLGLPRAPLDGWLAFHLVFGKTVPDISLNAVANLGYAEGRWVTPLYAGDTVTASSEVIGLKENSNGKTGVVYVRSTGVNQNGDTIVEYVRWVMVNKRDHGAPAPAAVVPDLADFVPLDRLIVPAGLDFSAWDVRLAGGPHLWDDYEVGEKIDHADGVTVEEAEHMMATRLYQNTARVHFNQFEQEKGRFARRLIYGGHVISLARSLSFNGLANAGFVAALNAGAHVAPLFAGDTVFAWSEILDKGEIPGRADVGALRLRTTATKNLPCGEFPGKLEGRKYAEGVILDLDTWVLMPCR